LEEKMKEIVGHRETAAPTFALAHTPTMEEEVRAEAEQHAQRIYEQILAEKKAQAGSPFGIFRANGWRWCGETGIK